MIKTIKNDENDKNDKNDKNERYDDIHFASIHHASLSPDTEFGALLPPDFNPISTAP
jgi:hypothetical protein